MRAILLAAGLGTRLRPLTDTVPKCLVPIKGKPLLQIWLEKLTESGQGPFLINTHYLHEQVERYINSSIYCTQTTLSFEPTLLGTAGTLIANASFFENSDGMLIHADNYCLEDMRKLIDAHHCRPDNCSMTMMTFRTDNPSSCGIVETDSNGVVTGFYEKVANPPGNLANGAIYVLSADFVRKLKVEFSFATDFSTEILGSFLGKIYTYETDKVLLDIGTLKGYNMVA